MHEIRGVIGSGYRGADGGEARMEPLEASLEVRLEVIDSLILVRQREIHIRIGHPDAG